MLKRSQYTASLSLAWLRVMLRRCSFCIWNLARSCTASYGVSSKIRRMRARRFKILSLSSGDRLPRIVLSGARWFLGWCLSHVMWRSIACVRVRAADCFTKICKNNRWKRRLLRSGRLNNKRVSIMTLPSLRRPSERRLNSLFSAVVRKPKSRRRCRRRLGMLRTTCVAVWLNCGRLLHAHD